MQDSKGIQGSQAAPAPQQIPTKPNTLPNGRLFVHIYYNIFVIVI